MEEIDFKDLISQKEAAEIRNTTRSAINELIKRGRLKVIVVGEKKLLSRKEVSTFNSQQGKKVVE